MKIANDHCTFLKGRSEGNVLRGKALCLMSAGCTMSGGTVEIRSVNVFMMSLCGYIRILHIYLRLKEKEIISMTTV